MKRIPMFFLLIALLVFSACKKDSDGNSPPPAANDQDAPAALAGVDQNVYIGDTVTLDAYRSRSYDSDKNTITYEWSVYPPLDFTIESTIVNPSFVAPEISGISDTNTFALTITDASGKTACVFCKVILAKQMYF